MMFSQNLLMVFLAMPGGMEWIMIILAVVLLFGGKKIPELMKGIGKGIKEFKDAKDNVKQELEDGMMEKDRELAKLKEPLRS
jgi:sec-independent protein translocase protein TatA